MAAAEAPATRHPSGLRWPWKLLSKTGLFIVHLEQFSQAEQVENAAMIALS